MNEAEFLTELTEILQSEQPVKPETILSDQEGWDSLAWMMILALTERESLKPITMESLRSPGSARALYSLLTEDK